MKVYLFFILMTFVLASPACKNSVKSETEKTSSTVQKSGPQDISTDEFEAAIKKRNVVVLDVRTPEEIVQGHIKGAIFSNFYDDDFQAKMSSYEKNKSYYIYCKSGGRSGQASQQFSEAGFDKVYNLEGGFDKWSSEGREIIIPKY